MAYEYKVLGKTVALELDPSVVAVRFQDDQPRSVWAAATAAAGAGSYSKRFEVPGEKLTIVPAPTTAAGGGQAEAVDLIGALNSQAMVEQALPVFRVDGNQAVATDRIIVGLESADTLEEVAAKHGLTPVEAWDDTAVLRAPPGMNPFDAIAALDADPAVTYAEPDLVLLGRHLPQRVGPSVEPLLSDPLVMGQYAMRLTQAVAAWQIAHGNPDIRIAILDEGVDTNHADLKAAIVGTYDATDDDSFQEPNAWDGHGTACAGLAAAVANNTGIRGSGAGCSILAVRIAYSASDGGPWVTSNSVITRAIRWAWTNGAAVISNSWGGGAPSNAIAVEIGRARTKGRDGLGAVVVAAASNSFSAVSFPANLPGVLTVSASNQYDEPKTPTSKDGEYWWGTCHGPEVDVAAPGVQNLTTDNSGAAGYDGGDYAPRFNGTSSSTPIVAGACGLMLSANPNLTEAQVRQIIVDTADKVGPVPYGITGRNDFMGYGRLNVLSAVRAAAPATVGAAQESDANQQA